MVSSISKPICRRWDLGQSTVDGMCLYQSTDSCMETVSQSAWSGNPFQIPLPPLESVQLVLSMHKSDMRMWELPDRGVDP